MTGDACAVITLKYLATMRNKNFHQIMAKYLNYFEKARKIAPSQNNFDEELARHGYFWDKQGEHYGLKEEKE